MTKIPKPAKPTKHLSDASVALHTPIYNMHWSAEAKGALQFMRFRHGEHTIRDLLTVPPKIIAARYPKSAEELTRFHEKLASELAASAPYPVHDIDKPIDVLSNNDKHKNNITVGPDEVTLFRMARDQYSAHEGFAVTNKQFVHHLLTLWRVEHARRKAQEARDDL